MSETTKSETELQDQQEITAQGQPEAKAPAEEPKLFVIQEDLVLAILKFLGEQKAKDVVGLIGGLQSLRPVTLNP